MRVLDESKHNKLKYPLKITCKKCGANLEVEETDVYIGALGLGYVICPVCRKATPFDEVEFEVTKDNVVFPQHFFHSVNGVDISPEEIRETIKKGIDFFRENPEAFTWTTQFGNMWMTIFNYSGDEEYHVNITKDYYDIFIHYADADYAAQLNSNGWQNEGAVYIKDHLVSQIKERI